MSLSGNTVPVLLETADNAPQLLYAWTRMYHYGHFALPTMSVSICILYLSAAIKTDKGFGALLAAALVAVTMVSFTWIFMGPLNDELFRLQAASMVSGQFLALKYAPCCLPKCQWPDTCRIVPTELGNKSGICNNNLEAV